MIRTIEVLFAIIIIASSCVAVSYFIVLPPPSEVSPMNLRSLSFTTLQMLDSSYDLSNAAFQTDNATLWNRLQVALSACLPPNVVYNMSVYDVNDQQGQVYNYVASISNTKNLNQTNDVATYTVASSNVTFNVTPQKIGEATGGTLYILNCSDANGWWITGYTAQNLAQDVYNLLSPYFVDTIMVQNTTQLGQILNGTALDGETLQNAVLINTFGEAVPIPSGYYTSSGVGYDSTHSSYARYDWVLGQRVLQYNWTWVSIVGYPLYYVSNTGYFSGSGDSNGWGIYGMRQVNPSGLNAFLRGLDNQSYAYDTTSIAGSPGLVELSSQVVDVCNYYGIYPSTTQTSTRALPSSILSTYHLNITTSVFDSVGNWNPAAVYRHNVLVNGTNQYQGGFYAIGLTRTPDIRISALGLLSDYKPRLYSSDYTTQGTSRLVVLQLALAGDS